MDSFELNKIMGAVLGTLLFVMGAGFVAEAVYHPIEDNGPGYALPEPVADAGGAVEEAAPEVPLGTLLASADATRGAAAVRKCQSCHNFGEGEPNKQGPHLYDVVGRAEGSVEDFAYSDALLAHNAAGDIWTYENLNAFLAYLQSLSASPVPFPTAEPVAAEAAAPASEPVAPAPGPVVTDGEAPAAAPAEAPALAPESVIETPTTAPMETEVQGTPTTTAQ